MILQLTIRPAPLNRKVTELSFSILKMFYRNLNLSSAALSRNHNKSLIPSTKNQEKLMKKVIGKQSKNLNVKSTNFETFDVNLSGGMHLRKPYFMSKLRIQRLNSLLTETITDILSTGSVSYDIHDYDIEITKVELTKFSDAVKVYWCCSNPDQMEDLKELLKIIAPKLRQEVLELQVVGHMPIIVFVEDTTIGKDRLLENLFKETRLDIERLEMLNNVISFQDNSDETVHDIANMKTNTYGVNHKKLMDLVKQRTNKQVNHQSKLQNEANKNIHLHTLDTKRFENFLIDRRRKQLKANKQLTDQTEIYDHMNEFEDVSSDTETVIVDSDDESDEFYHSDDSYR